MARRLDKERALQLRVRGKSYSEIKTTLGISKSTLSGWLKNYPLSKKRLKELQSHSEKRIEHFRDTMARKRQKKINLQHKKVEQNIKNLSKRDLFIGGFFLFWGEGAKGRNSQVALANTDPSIIKFFIQWLDLLGVERTKIKFTLHLYRDMNIENELRFWSKELRVAQSQFHKPYIKNTNQSNITYKTGFGHGTCNARYFNQELNDYVLMGMKVIKDRLT